MTRSILEVCAVQFTFTRFIAPLALKLQSCGWKVSAAYTIDKSSGNLSNNTCDSIRIYPLKIYRSAKLINIISSFFSVSCLLRRSSHSFIHVHTPIASYLVRLYHLISDPFCKQNLIYTVHGFYFHKGSSTPVAIAHYIIELFLCIKVKAYFFVSKADLQFARRYLPISNSKLYYTPNGVDTDLFFCPSPGDRMASRCQFGFDSNDIVVGYVGRLVNEKGLKDLFRAFEILKKVSPSLKLLVCGGRLGSDYDYSLDEQIQYLLDAYSGSVILTGMIENRTIMRDCFHAMDIFCLPSYREGLPTSLLEAMSCGLPSVVTNIRGSNELIANMKNGFVIPTHNPRELASAIHRLAVDQALRNEMGDYARNYVKSQFDLNEVLESQVNLFDYIYSSLGHFDKKAASV